MVQAEEQGEVVLPMATRPHYSAILQEDWDPLDYVGRLVRHRQHKIVVI